MEVVRIDKPEIPILDQDDFTELLFYLDVYSKGFDIPELPMYIGPYFKEVWNKFEDLIFDNQQSCIYNITKVEEPDAKVLVSKHFNEALFTGQREFSIGYEDEIKEILEEYYLVHNKNTYNFFNRLFDIDAWIALTGSIRRKDSIYMVYDELKTRFDWRI